MVGRYRGASRGCCTSTLPAPRKRTKQRIAACQQRSKREAGLADKEVGHLWSCSIPPLLSYKMNSTASGPSSQTETRWMGSPGPPLDVSGGTLNALTLKKQRSGLTNGKKDPHNVPISYWQLLINLMRIKHQIRIVCV